MSIFEAIRFQALYFLFGISYFINKAGKCLDCGNNPHYFSSVGIIFPSLKHLV